VCPLWSASSIMPRLYHKLTKVIILHIYTYLIKFLMLLNTHNAYGSQIETYNSILHILPLMSLCLIASKYCKRPDYRLVQKRHRLRPHAFYTSLRRKLSINNKQLPLRLVSSLSAVLTIFPFCPKNSLLHICAQLSCLSARTLLFFPLLRRAPFLLRRTLADISCRNWWSHPSYGLWCRTCRRRHREKDRNSSQPCYLM